MIDTEKTARGDRKKEVVKAIVACGVEVKTSPRKKLYHRTHVKSMRMDSVQM
jgi:hypothetical protein